MSRMAILLRAAADALDDNRDPFHEAFLNEHNVTIDECFALSGALSQGARLIAWATEHPDLARAAIQGAHLAGLQSVLHDLTFGRGARG